MAVAAVTRASGTTITGAAQLRGVAATVVVAVPLWLPGLGSEVAEVAVAVLVSTVPGATLGLTATVRVKTALPGACVGLEQLTVPAAPTAGVVHDQPPG